MNELLSISAIIISSIALIKVAQLIKIVEGHDKGINKLLETIFKHKK